MTTDEPLAAVPGQQAPPGWYPDPVDEHQQRYFDGVSWSAHTAARPGHPASPTPPRRRFGRWVVAAGVAVIAIAAGSVIVLRGSGEDDPVQFPTISVAAEENAPVGETATVTGGEFIAGEDIEGVIDEGQRWQVMMNVPEDSLILLDARPVPPGGGDLTMFAYDDDGEQVAGNDDRGELSRIGGEDLDPILVLGAPPGSVEIVVGSWLDESSTEFLLRTSVPEQIGTEFDETWQSEAGATEIRTLVVSEPGPYLFEVMADGGAHGFFLDMNSGELTTWRSGAEHIAEELQVDPGSHLLIASRDGLDAGELQMRISPA